MKTLSKLASTGLFAHALVFAAQASADASEGWTYTNPPEGVETDIESAIMNITNYILGFIAIVATLIIIYGGILYLTSAGDSGTISKAKSTIVYGIVGLLVCGLAYAMVVVVKTVIISGGA